MRSSNPVKRSIKRSTNPPQALDEWTEERCLAIISKPLIGGMSGAGIWIGEGAGGNPILFVTLRSPDGEGDTKEPIANPLAYVRNSLGELNRKRASSRRDALIAEIVEVRTALRALEQMFTLGKLKRQQKAKLIDVKLKQATHDLVLAARENGARWEELAEDYLKTNRIVDRPDTYTAQQLASAAKTRAKSGKI